MDTILLPFSSAARYTSTSAWCCPVVFINSFRAILFRQRPRTFLLPNSDHYFRVKDEIGLIDNVHASRSESPNTTTDHRIALVNIGRLGIFKYPEKEKEKENPC